MTATLASTQTEGVEYARENFAAATTTDLTAEIRRVAAMLSAAQVDEPRPLTNAYRVGVLQGLNESLAEKMTA